MLFTAVVLGVVLAGHSIAIPTTSAPSFTVKETIPSPRKWTQTCHAPPDHRLQLKIALPQPNFHVLEQHLYEVSDPGHSRYGQHLSKGEVEELVAPHAESIALVDEWLRFYDVDIEVVPRSPAKDWVAVHVPVSVAESMLDTVSSLHLFDAQNIL